MALTLLNQIFQALEQSPGVYRVDPRARLYAAFPPPYGVQDVVEALLAILPGADNKNSQAIPSGRSA